MKRVGPWRVLVGGLFCVAAVVAVLSATAVAQAEVREEMVTMRDGVRLATDIIVPEGDGPWPVVVSRTPYGKGSRRNAEKRERQFLDADYVRVVQDCRGRFKSEGEYRAFEDDMEDGYDTVEWVASQPWCDGKIAMFGGSAGGITSNLAAMSGAPHLVCAYVLVGHGCSYRYANYPGGVFLKNMNEEWLRKQGVPPADVPRPIHRLYDESQSRLDMANCYERMTTPIYNIGGWYDIFSQGTIDAFVGLHNRGAGRARGNQRLVMGAFGHGPLSGDLKYPTDSMPDVAGDVIRWFDYWLKGQDNGIKDEPSVRYYVMGDTFDADAPGNQWRTAANWPPESEITAYYLRADGKLTREKPDSDEGQDVYTYDPKDPVPTQGGNNLMIDRGPMDQRDVSGRDDVLTYETAVLEHPVEIAGQVYVELYVSTEAEDTDFMAKLVDVYPNGYEALVLDGAFRLRYHDGFDKVTRVEKGKVYKIKLDLWSTALVFNKGHKIALHVTSSNSPRFEPHSNTWEPVASYDLAVPAVNTVYRGAETPSRMLLPVTKIYDTAASAAGP